MIFKKPYAFLIKYFRLINFILSAFLIYVIYKSYHIINFFNNYVNNNYSGSFYLGFAENYISPLIYFVLILILIGIFWILVLFIYKKKPVKSYLLGFIYYIFYIIFLIIIKKIMMNLVSSTISAEMARIYRDLSIITFVPHLIFFIIFLIRGLGLNLKKFNFDADLKIEDKDNEEVEITLNSDGVRLKRNIRRFGREFIYYIKENKFIFTIICIVLFILIIYLGYQLLPQNVDERYQQGDEFIIEGVNFKIEDSIITNLDFKGDEINDNYFLVLKLAVDNKTENNFQLAINKFRLELNKGLYYPSKEYSIKFVDYAKSSYNSVISPNNKTVYSLVYEIKPEDIKKTYKIKVDGGIVSTKKGDTNKYNYINISPIVLDKIINEGIYNEGDVISFINSNLGNTTFKVQNTTITDRYYYNYEKCDGNYCNTYKNVVNIDYLKNNTTLLIFDYDYQIDETIPFYSNLSTVKNFIDSFAKVKYTINGEEFKADAVDITPNTLKGKLVIETTNKILEATEVSLAITIRNKEYVINIS